MTIFDFSLLFCNSMFLGTRQSNSVLWTCIHSKEACNYRLVPLNLLPSLSKSVCDYLSEMLYCRTLIYNQIPTCLAETLEISNTNLRSSTTWGCFSFVVVCFFFSCSFHPLFFGVVRWGGQNNVFGYLHLLRCLGFFYLFSFLLLLLLLFVVVSSDLGGMLGRVGRGEESD